MLYYAESFQRVFCGGLFLNQSHLRELQLDLFHSDESEFLSYLIELTLFFQGILLFEQSIPVTLPQDAST